MRRERGRGRGVTPTACRIVVGMTRFSVAASYIDLVSATMSPSVIDPVSAHDRSVLRIGLPISTRTRRLGLIVPSEQGKQLIVTSVTSVTSEVVVRGH